MSLKMRSNIMLFITAFIWGTAFVAQKSGMDYVEPFTFNGIRTLIGAVVLTPVIIVMDRRKKAAPRHQTGAVPMLKMRQGARRAQVAFAWRTLLRNSAFYRRFAAAGCFADDHSG